MFWAAADRSLAALSEIAYHLNMADGLSLLSKEDHQRLESLRGRAVFYTRPGKARRAERRPRSGRRSTRDPLKGHQGVVSFDLAPRHSLQRHRNSLELLTLCERDVGNGAAILQRR